MKKASLPGDDDNDEDLLEMQRKFFAERKSNSDVKIKKSVNPQVGDMLEALQQPPKVIDHVVRSEKDLESLPDEERIVGDIRERPDTKIGRSSYAAAEKRLPFPETFVRDKQIVPKAGKKRESLFALQMKKKRGIVAEPEPEPMDVEPSSEKPQLPATFLSHTPMLTPDEVKQISDENAAKLAAMTQEELLDEQRKLLSQLDPKVVEFLKKGRKPTTGVKRGAEGPSKKSVKFSKFDDIREIDENELPVNPKEAKKWTHMDKVEMDKLKWMTELPPPKPVDPKTGYTARFNFKGEVVAPDADIPVTHALHHHGEEPERAGYSLEELFTLARSTLRQQKILAMDTLAAILRKNKEGYFDLVLNQILIKELLDSGLLIILRIALDEQVDSVISSALNALCALLSNKPDELCLDRVASWSRGFEQPSLPTSVDIEENQKKHFSEEGEELKDSEILQIDVIRACFRMDLLERIRYVLSNFELPAVAVISAIEILTRISRHSLESATAVFECDGLLDKIFEEYLPPHRLMPGVKPKMLEKVNGVPLRQALKLVRVLAARGVNLATRIVKKYPIMKSIAAYITMEPSESMLPIQEALRLSIEAFQTWRTFLSYGLTTEDCSHLFPVVTKQLLFYQSKISLNVGTVENKFNYDLAAALLGLVETMFVVAGTHEKLLKLQKLHSVSVPVPEINWDLAHPVGELVVNLTLKWTHEVDTYFSDITDSGMQAAASAMSATTSFYKCLTKQSICNMVQTLNAVETLFDRTAVRLLKSKHLEVMLQQMCLNSVIVTSEETGTKRDPPNLPSLGAVVWGGAVSPIIRENSRVSILVSFFKLTFELCRISKNLLKHVELLWKNEALVKYVKKVTSFAGSLANHWFAKFESELLYWILKLAAESQPSDSALFHMLGLVYTITAPSMDDYLLQDIFQKVVFNRSFLGEEELLVEFNSMGLGQEKTGSSLAKQAIQSLPRIRSIYEALFFPEIKISASEAIISRVPQGLSTLTMPHGGSTALPSDWPFVPLVAMLNREPSRSRSSDVTPPEEIEGLKHIMMWIYLLQLTRKTFVNQLSPISRFTRIACLFLAGSDFFLDKTVSAALLAVLHLILTESPFLNFNRSIPGLAHFKDLYMSLIEQFEAVSYGDPVFGAYMLTPLLQPKHNSEIKRLVWGEHPMVLRTLTTSDETFPMPLNQYMKDAESDPVIIQMYAAAVFSGTVTKARNPVLYDFAMWNTKEFISRNQDVAENAKLVKSISERLVNYA